MKYGKRGGVKVGESQRDEIFGSEGHMRLTPTICGSLWTINGRNQAYDALMVIRLRKA